jgi:hypothetical protein
MFTLIHYGLDPTCAFANDTLGMGVFGVLSPHGALPVHPPLHESEGWSSTAGGTKLGLAIGSNDDGNESRQSGEETSPSRKKAAIPESHRGVVCLISVDLSARKSWYRY